MRGATPPLTLIYLWHLNFYKMIDGKGRRERVVNYFNRLLLRPTAERNYRLFEKIEKVVISNWSHPERKSGTLR
jgi:hypothetical protein